MKHEGADFLSVRSLLLGAVAKMALALAVWDCVCGLQNVCCYGGGILIELKKIKS